MSAEAKLRGVSVWDKDLKKSFRAMILDELKKAELRVPELLIALRLRSDLRWWHKLYLWTVASGGLYVLLPRMEDAGMVDAVVFESSSGVTLTCWRGRTLCEMVVDWRAVPDGEGGFSPGEEIYCSNFAVAMVEKTVPACEACATRTREEGIPITPLVPPESTT